MKERFIHSKQQEIKTKNYPKPEILGKLTDVIKRKTLSSAAGFEKGDILPDSLKSIYQGFSPLNRVVTGINTFQKEVRSLFENTKRTDIKEAPYDRDNKVSEELFSNPEYVKQPGVQVAMKLLDRLEIPYGQFSGLSLETKNSKKYKSLTKDRVLAETLTNKSGGVFKMDDCDYTIRDPRILLNNEPQSLISAMDAMDPALREVFKNESEHNAAKTLESPGQEDLQQFAYLKLPGGVDCVLKGYIHTGKWQKEHGEYLVKSAKQAKVLCVEGFSNVPYGDSLPARWKDPQDNTYGLLIKDTVKSGFKGYFAEIDMRNTSKINLDSLHEPETDNKILYPDLPDEYYQKHFDYLKKFFPTDSLQIKNEQNLKEILKKLSSSDQGIIHNYHVGVDGISIVSSQYVNGDLESKSQPTGLELGEMLFSDAMSALKIHLIAKQMNEGKIDKGIIVDVQGAMHLETKYFFLRNPLLAMITVLKNPQFALMNKLAKEEDITSIYQAFSPDEPTAEKNFKNIFSEINRLEIQSPVRLGLKKEMDPAQMTLQKYKMPRKNTIFEGKVLETPATQDLSK